MLNFKVQGYSKAEYPDKNNKYNLIMHDTVDIWVFAKNSAEAIKKAHAIIKRKFYRIARVDEHFHPNLWDNFPWGKIKKLLKS